MGCGVSKDCIADPSLTKSKKRLIHACREHLQHAIISVDKQPAAAPTAIVVPHNEYTHLRDTPTLEEQGDADVVTIDEHDDDDDIDINVNDTDIDNDIHFPVHEEEEDHMNADEVITINPDDSEYLENKPPASQPLTLPHHNYAYTARGGNNAHTSRNPQKTVHKPPLRELSIASNGKLDIKKDHLGIFTIHTSSTPRSNSYYGGISPSRPSVKARSSSSSPLHADKVKLLSPMRAAWNPHDAQSPNFIKSFADHQLCKEVESTDSDELKVVGHSYNPLPASKTSVVEFDGDKKTEEVFKSHTDITIDGFIEDLQDAFDSNQLTSRLVAYGNLAGSPKSYMKELLEHFDKSTESLHMPTTPRADTWQSKLLETIDRDIDSILLEEQSGVTANLGKDRNTSTGNHHIDHTRYDSIEL
ncbi:hypothetical protein GOP47_0014339 [Adiantum capillus-veneris]|uniref:Uncharacterized protein n=1 Tax=Adiantum capillus-veneris TaxID=13818 RepID=A0A9D4ULE4_ADICA|nr:hypothetical protein GOP47_0014339 [Adiantum capillus-veneris]